MTVQDKTITFVIPWYGKDLLGGAESQCRNTVEHLAKIGVNVEVFTTCSKSFHDSWSDYYPSGIEKINNITVHRFPTDIRDEKLFDSINFKILNKMPITYDEEIQYIKNSINSSSLIKQITNDQDFRIFVFLPYLYGTTYCGCNASPKNSILIPCLHDEGYAYFQIFKELFPKIRGMIFNSTPEEELAKTIFPTLSKHITVGEGVTPFSYGNSNLQKKFKFDNYILYVGKKDKNKNVHVLVNYFCKYIKRNKTDLHLILTGPGEITIPKDYKQYVHSFLLSNQDLYSAYCNALVTCQPSLNESFSLVIMESWLCNTPVLVHEKCTVTNDHCSKSNGGLYFSNYHEFEECVNFFLTNPEKRQLMGINGQKYVNENFQWDAIIKKYLNFIDSCKLN
jgi:glycosyltransferase involved in cell wall biosynthesis